MVDGPLCLLSPAHQLTGCLCFLCCSLLGLHGLLRAPPLPAAQDGVQPPEVAGLREGLLRDGDEFHKGSNGHPDQPNYHADNPLPPVERGSGCKVSQERNDDDLSGGETQKEDENDCGNVQRRFECTQKDKEDLPLRYHENRRGSTTRIAKIE